MHNISHTFVKTRVRTHRQRDRQTDRPNIPCILQNRQTNREADKQKDKQTNRKTDKQTNRQTDKQTNRQTDKQTYRHTDRQTDRQTDSLMRNVVKRRAIYTSEQSLHSLHRPELKDWKANLSWSFWSWNSFSHPGNVVGTINFESFKIHLSICRTKA